MASASGEPLSCSGCGRSFLTPALGSGGEAVCPTCGAPVGDGPAPDDTLAFQRFYTAPPTPAPTGLRALLARLFRRR
jgi:hypothetical protein